MVHQLCSVQNSQQTLTSLWCKSVSVACIACLDIHIVTHPLHTYLWLLVSGIMTSCTISAPLHLNPKQNRIVWDAMLLTQRGGPIWHCASRRAAVCINAADRLPELFATCKLQYSNMEKHDYRNTETA